MSRPPVYGPADIVSECEYCGLVLVWNYADQAWFAEDAAPRMELVCEPRTASYDNPQPHVPVR